jgi:predicted metalloprotease
MLWQGRRQSTNVEDRRGARPLLIGGGVVGVLVTLVALFLGVDPSGLAPSEPEHAAPNPAQNELASFAGVVLADTEDVWSERFAQRGQVYREPTLVLFDGAVESACGYNTSAVGPFYCPNDEKLYLDLSFFRELEARHGAPGDFARAYVIAHEIGHHVQKLTGVFDRVAESRGDGRREANRLSVAMELQADCYAGVWAHHAQRMQHILEPGDIEEALGAASAIGDDRLQREAQGYVVPDSFTHGTSQQRSGWFRRGFEQGTIESCDTFEMAGSTINPTNGANAK